MIKWIKGDCHKEALKYKYKSEFKKNSYGAYQAMLRNNWQNELCSHMIPLGNEYKRMIYRIIFPNNICYVGLTSNINRRINEHFNKKGVVFSYIKNSNLIPIIEHLTEYIPVNDAKIQEEYWRIKSENDGYYCLNSAKTGGIGSNLKWTKERCQDEALKYKTRGEFQNKSHSAYNSARKNNWLDEICSHMVLLHNKWTKDDCKKEALKYNNRGEFAKNNHKIWSFAKKYNWLDEICSHMILLHNNYSKDECRIEALKYDSRNKFKKYNHKVWQFAQKHKFLDEICSHMILLRHTWTEDECKNEALKYKNITEFARKNHNIYEFARKRRWTYEINKNN
jgi:predicted GIY-YIG superfamily endonuclease